MAHVTADAKEAFEAAGAELAAAIDAVLAGWVLRSVARRLPPDVADPGAVEAAARAAGTQARAETMPVLRRLLAAEPGDTVGSPLAVLRDAVRFPTAVLRDAGVPPVRRDRFATEHFPDDVYDLAPASWSEVDPSLHEPGLVWGAAKAHLHLSRHRHHAP